MVNSERTFSQIFLWPVYKIGTSINNSGSNLAKEQQSTWTGFLSNGGGLSSQPYVLTKWQFWSDMNILKKVRLDMKRRYQTTVLFSQPYIGLRLTRSSTTHLGGLPSEESNSVKHVVGRSSLSKQELLQHRKLLLLYSFKGLKFSA